MDCATTLVLDGMATVQMPPELAAAGAKIDIRHDSPNYYYGNGEQFPYVPGQEIYLRTVRPERLASVVIDNNDLAHPRVLRRPSRHP